MKKRKKEKRKEKTNRWKQKKQTKKRIMTKEEKKREVKKNRRKVEVDLQSYHDMYWHCENYKSGGYRAAQPTALTSRPSH